MRRAITWVVGVVGAAALFFGLFILFAGDNQYLGFGGASWRVGDISSNWAYGLLAGGGLLLAALLGALAAGRGRHS